MMGKECQTKMKLFKKIVTGLLAAALLLMTAGCSGDSTTTGSSTSNASSAASSSEASSSQKQTEPYDADPSFQLAMPEEGEEIAVMTTSMGVIKMRLFPEQAPKAVENFVTHAKEGYYDGLTFHRVMEDFMIQGGDPNGDGTGGESIWGEGFGYEYSPELCHFRGALAMAHSSLPDSNGSQFYIVQAGEGTVTEEMFTMYEQYGYQFDLMPEAMKEKYLEIGGTPWLDGLYVPEGQDGHTVFGQVFEGLDVVDAIATVEKEASTDGNAPSVPVEPIIIESIEIVNYEG